ncbi:endonuclease/exonuclease/phosphatase family protein [Sinorhizobium medicae]|uniref:endonuclease/exonuclease/phosphatase family protein n=1 Tax=Sinorhizobium medicae TaxID=110321 RepID=UPI000FD9D597|nr:endonuclease/exonuclease/phosphatase family protein [Sinorhizobium medicae]RVJ77336.1 hypothetical protein CN168_19500 [Sinorhizobium medicae]
MLGARAALLLLCITAASLYDARLLAAQYVKTPDPTVLRIGIWNIANFWIRRGVPAMGERGTSRSEEGLNAVKRVIETVNADVWLLQEIVDIRSLNWLARPRYVPIISAEYLNANRRGQRDLFTAFLVADGIHLYDAYQLGVSRRYIDDEREAFTRPGQALVLLVGGLKILLVNVHLKSGCTTTRDTGTSINLKCNVNAEELNGVIDDISGRNDFDIVIVAGDFNRAYNKIGAYDTTLRKLYRYLSMVTPTPSMPIRLPEQALPCIVRKEAADNQIDYFFIGGKALRFVRDFSIVSVETSRGDMTPESKVSDHCAYVLSIVLD